MRFEIVTSTHTVGSKWSPVFNRWLGKVKRWLFFGEESNTVESIEICSHELLEIILAWWVGVHSPRVFMRLSFPNQWKHYLKILFQVWEEPLAVTLTILTCLPSRGPLLQRILGKCRTHCVLCFGHRVLSKNPVINAVHDCDWFLLCVRVQNNLRGQHQHRHHQHQLRRGGADAPLAHERREFPVALSSYTQHE